MLKKKVPYKKINKEIAKLRKYSFQSYVMKNINALTTDPKGCHRCIQNIIGWNITLGSATTINDNVDMDP